MLKYTKIAANTLGIWNFRKKFIAGLKRIEITKAKTNQINISLIKNTKYNNPNAKIIFNMLAHEISKIRELVPPESFEI